MKQLSLCRKNEDVTIERVEGSGAFRRRLMELGFIRGTGLRVVAFSPLRGPLQLLLMNCRLTLGAGRSRNSIGSEKWINKRNPLPLPWRVTPTAARLPFSISSQAPLKRWGITVG